MWGVNWEGTVVGGHGSLPLEEIEIGVEAPADALEEEDADDDVDEVALHAHVVAPDHAEDLVEDVADLDAAEGEGPALDPEHEVLHLEREDLLVDDGVGLPAALHHQMAGAVPVELGDGLEEVEEVFAVRGVEGRDEARVDEDELGPVAFLVDLVELEIPRFRVVSVGAQLLEDFFRDVGRVRGRVGLLASA